MKLSIPSLADPRVFDEGSRRHGSRRCRLLVTVLALAVATCGQSPDGEVKRSGGAIVESLAEPLDITEPGMGRVGRLRYRGGLSLSSADERFGGLSGLAVAENGQDFVAVSDVGYWVTGGLLYDQGGNLGGVENVFLEPFKQLNGEPIHWGGENDAEALATTAAGDFVIAFERHHRIWRHPRPGARPKVLAPPADLREQPYNGGMEAITMLADGRLMALSEHLESNGGTVGWVQTPSGGWGRFTWKTSGGFRPTGAATLPDGRILVLERRFPPVGARLRIVPATAIIAGGTADGQEIARLEGSITVDNMEGVAVRREPDGATLIYLVSDDNFNTLQRTLLMMFELDD